MLTFALHHPIAATGYAFLIVALLSIWIYRKIWVWAPLLAISYTFAYYGNIIELKALAPLTILGFCYFFASKNITGFARLFATLAAAIITIALFTHFVIGFHNILLFPNWQASKASLSINIYANYDKALVALLILGLYTPSLIQSKKELYDMLIKTLPWMLLAGAVILALTQFLQILHWDPKLPSITPTWLLLQLFFVVLPEELFYRGFVQKELADNLNNPLAGLGAIVITSLLFTLLHILFIPNLAFLVTVFITSLFYGGIYQITRSIESSILTHYFVNLCHFFFFTYPINRPLS